MSNEQSLITKLKERFNNYFDKNWRWENYKVFFQLIIFKYLVMWFSLVPIAVGIISQLPDPLEIMINDKIVEINLVLPFNWQLLWGASFFFVIAFVLYQLFCPHFIKKYNNFTDYLSCSHDHRWLAWEASRMWNEVDDKQKYKFINTLFEKKKMIAEVKTIEENYLITPQIELKQTVFYLKYAEKYYSLGLPQGHDIDSKNEAQIGIFHEIFGRYTASKETVRKCIFTLLCFSSILFSFALLQHIIKGAYYALQWLCSSNTYIEFLSFCKTFLNGMLN